jgi:hypothetical protein
MARERMGDRRRTWRQKVVIVDDATGSRTGFYVDFGEYSDGRLAELFVTSSKMGTFARGTMDSLARSVSLALQCGTSPHEMAKTLLGQCYPPAGRVEADGSLVTECTSIADYIGREIMACYGDDGRRRVMGQG